MKPLRISQFSYHPLYIPVYVAIEKGFIPYTVLFESKHNDDAVIEDVYQGKADIGIGDPVIVEYEKYREKIQCIGVFIDKYSNSIITLNPLRKPFKSVKDLKGLKIGCYPKPTTSYTLLKDILAKAGLNIDKDVEIIPLQGNRELGPLYSGEADVCVVAEPIASQAIANGATTVLKLWEMHPPMAISGFTCLKTIDPKIAKEFLKGIQQGINIIFTDENTTLTIAQKYFPDVERKSLQHAINQMKKLGYKKTPEIDEKEWKTALSYRDEIKKKPKTYAYSNAYIEKKITTSFS